MSDEEGNIHPRIFHKIENIFLNEDFHSPPDGAVFICAHVMQDQVTEFFMRNRDHQALKDTQAGQSLTALPLFGADSPLEFKDASTVWRAALKLYAAQASGDVTILGDLQAEHGEGILAGVVLPELENNCRVDKINGIPKRDFLSFMDEVFAQNQNNKKHAETVMDTAQILRFSPKIKG